MLDDELRDLVSVDPSRDWLTRVSAQVAADAARPRNLAHSPISLVAVVLFVGALVVSLAPRSFRSALPISDDRMIPSRALALDPSALPARTAMRGAVRPEPTQLRPSNSAHTAIPAPTDPIAAVQIDSREARTLQQLFAAPPLLHALDVREPEAGPIVMPEISIDPILNSPVEGARQ